MKRWSYSAIEDYLSCAWKYRLRRVDGQQGEVSLNAVAGKAFHQITEDWDGDGGVKWPSWAGTLDMCIAEEIERTGVPFNKWRISGKAGHKEDLAKWLTILGPQMIDKYEEWRNRGRLEIARDLPPDASENTGGIEYEVNVTVGGVHLRGFVDRIMVDELGNLGVVDIKTGARKRKTIQLKTYVFALQKMGIPVTWSSYYYARTGTLTTPDFSVWDESKLSHLYAQVAEMEERGYYPPSPSDDCSWCSMRDHCTFAL